MLMVMKMKLKIIGKIKMRINNLNSRRKKVLNISKKFIVKNGWNENLFLKLSENSKYKIDELKVLFPNGYTALLEFYLNELNAEMILSSKKINLIRMKTHQRIKALIMLRLNNLQKEKDLFKKTYFILALPKHSKIAVMSLYKTVDEMWFLAGDISTDFNFYSKRAILASIYSATILYWINNNNLKQTTKFLDNQLAKVSKIPEIKNKIKNLFDLGPKIFSFFKI